MREYIKSEEYNNKNDLITMILKAEKAGLKIYIPPITDHEYKKCNKKYE